MIAVVDWRDKYGKSFIYDEKGNPRLVQFRNEQETTDRQILFSTDFHYPKKDLEYSRPFGYSSFEKGPSIVLIVPKKALEPLEINDARFELLDHIEGVYKRDLLAGQHGFSRLVKDFTEERDNSKRGQIAAYFQDRVQNIVDRMVQRKSQEALISDNAFDRLSVKQKQLVVAIQIWAKENNVKENTGKFLSFNSKSLDAFAELNRVVDYAKAHGFTMRSKSSLNPYQKNKQANVKNEEKSISSNER